MCDYSLQNVASRPAKVGDRLTTRDFGTRTRGFAAWEDVGVVVCVLPGTELVFENPVKFGATFDLFRRFGKRHDYRTAIFRQINKGRAAAHHDALEFPDGRIALLTGLKEGQEAVVLQLPTRGKNASELEVERRNLSGYSTRGVIGADSSEQHRPRGPHLEDPSGLDERQPRDHSGRDSGNGALRMT
jgi:hypothetical protein